MRAQHQGRPSRTGRVSLQVARENKVDIDWKRYTPPVPEQPGLHYLRSFPLEQLIDFIDWSPFFATWELAGRYPDILVDPVVGSQARELFDDARVLLDRIVNEGKLTAHGALGLFPANAVGDDIEIYSNEDRDQVTGVIHTLRQQSSKRPGRRNQALAGFRRPQIKPRCRLHGLFCCHYGNRGWKRWWRSSSEIMTTTAPLWSKRWPIDWQRRLLSTYTF